VRHKAINGFQRKDFTAGGEQKFSHVFPPYPESSADDARNNFIFWLIQWLAVHA
jgi:hypothetical protein